MVKDMLKTDQGNDNEHARELTPTAFKEKLFEAKARKKFFVKFYGTRAVCTRFIVFFFFFFFFFLCVTSIYLLYFLICDVLAPWCGHCKSMKEDWDSLAREIAMDETLRDVEIVSVDASIETDAKVSREEFEIKSFPTLYWFENGYVYAYDARNGRKLDALRNFVKSEKKTATTMKNSEARKFEFNKKTGSLEFSRPGFVVRIRKEFEDSAKVVLQVYNHKKTAVYLIYCVGLISGLTFASLFFFFVFFATSSSSNKSSSNSNNDNNNKPSNPVVEKKTN